MTGEIEANNAETKTLCELWLESLQTGCDETRKLFGIDISVDWRETTEPQTGDDNGGDSNAAVDNSAV